METRHYTTHPLKGEESFPYGIYTIVRFGKHSALHLEIVIKMAGMLISSLFWPRMGQSWM
jgi:hypothetical protein